MTAPVDAPDQVDPDATARDAEDSDDGLAAAVNAKQRKAAADEGDTYPGTDKFPIATREQAKNAVQLYGNSDLPAEKVKAWLKRRLKAKGWEDLIPDSWEDAVTAAGEPSSVPGIDRFRDPKLPGPTPLTVTDDGQVFGHLALWSSTHIGFPDRQITPPRSGSDYAYFHTGSRLVTDGAEQRVIPTGHITLDTGHAALDASVWDAAAHYDNTGALVADVCAGEDEHGIWVAGVTAPGLDELKLHKLRACGLSGDWRRIGGGLELVAALSVPTPGFPVPRSRVASGQSVALVAAGALTPLVAPDVDREAIAAAVVAAIDQRSERERLLAELTEDDPESWEERGELLATLLTDDADALTAANWVEQTGTGHLPRYIKRISKHLRAKGMTESHAIAVAVNAAKRMCASGDVNFPGKQSVNAGSRAEACRAVAEWEAKKAQARAT